MRRAVHVSLRPRRPCTHVIRRLTIQPLRVGARSPRRCSELGLVPEYPSWRPLARPQGGARGRSIRTRGCPAVRAPSRSQSTPDSGLSGPPRAGAQGGQRSACAARGNYASARATYAAADAVISRKCGEFALSTRTKESGPEYLDGSPVDVGAVETDGGGLALRRRPAEGGFKPPTAALTEDRCCERRGRTSRQDRAAAELSSATLNRARSRPKLSPHPYLWPCIRSSSSV